MTIFSSVFRFHSRFSAKKQISSTAMSASDISSAKCLHVFSYLSLLLPDGHINDAVIKVDNALNFCNVSSNSNEVFALCEQLKNFSLDEQNLLSFNASSLFPHFTCSGDGTGRTPIMVKSKGLMLCILRTFAHEVNNH